MSEAPGRELTGRSLKSLLNSGSTGQVLTRDTTNLGYDWAAAGGGVTVPEWIEYLAVRQSDETSHADDDFFTSDSSADYTEQTVTGSATWSIGRGVLSVAYDDQSTLDAAAFLKSLTSPTAPITIETALRSWSLDRASGDFAMAGILFTDGTATTSNSVVAEIGMSGTGDDAQWLIREGTLTDLNAGTFQTLSSLFSFDQFSAFDRIYLRLIWINTTTVATSMSIDGNYWIDLGVADLTITSFTPTHFGFWVSSYGGTVVGRLASFDYLRRDNTDKSI